MAAARPRPCTHARALPPRERRDRDGGGLRANRRDRLRANRRASSLERIDLDEWNLDLRGTRLMARVGVGSAFLLGSDSGVGLVLKLTLGIGGSY